MPLVTTTEMFKKAYEGGYAVGAFNVNNMEIVQGIVDAAKEEQSPLILQVSAGARKYAKHWKIAIYQSLFTLTTVILLKSVKIAQTAVLHLL